MASSPRLTVQIVQELYARQSFAIDGGEAERWADTFTPTGSFSSASYQKPAYGRDELIDFVRRFRREARQHRHWISAITVDETADGWMSHAYALIIGTDPAAQPQILRSVVIADSWQFLAGTWRIDKRVVQVDGKPAIDGTLGQ